MYCKSRQIIYEIFFLKSLWNFCEKELQARKHDFIAEIEYGQKARYLTQ